VPVMNQFIVLRLNHKLDHLFGLVRSESSSAGVFGILSRGNTDFTHDSDPHALHSAQQ
jgi:hypothetical protein